MNHRCTLLFSLSVLFLEINHLLCVTLNDAPKGKNQSKTNLEVTRSGILSKSHLSLCFLNCKMSVNGNTYLTRLLRGLNWIESCIRSCHVNYKFSDYGAYTDDYSSQGPNFICNQYIKSSMWMCNTQVTRSFLNDVENFKFPKFPGFLFFSW